MTVAAFIEQLCTHAPLPNVFNPWRDRCVHDADDQGPAIRRGHLKRYLEQRQKRARLLIIAEAPGFQGCHFSGIAMTSERLLLGHLAGPYRPNVSSCGVPPEAVFVGPKTRTSALTTPLPRIAYGANEPTASIVWRALLAHRVDPYAVVLWNAFPFHPYWPGEPLTNRPPGDALSHGEPFLTGLLALYPGTRVAAVGNPARDALDDRAQHVFRHPANGGATAFRAGLLEALSAAEILPSA